MYGISCSRSTQLLLSAFMALMSLREPLFLMLVAVVQFAIFAATASKNIRQDGSEMHAEGNGKLPAKSPCLHVPETECVP